MRTIDYQDAFDACVILSGTFGFFGDIEDQQLLHSIARALKPGGKTLIMFLSASRDPKRTRSWRELDDGWELTEDWLDSATSTYRGTVLIIRKDGTLLRPRPEDGYSADEVIRCYTVPELKRMLAEANLKFVASYSGDFAEKPTASGQDSVHSIIVAERV
jgi:SAM-dependent methyltransferase